MTEQMLTHSGDFTYIAREGAGPVVVFLHGIGSNATSFKSLFDILPAQWHCLAWNAPGYLGSAPLAEQWPLAEDYAAKLAQLLDDLGHGKVHLVGQSLGTLIGAAFARIYPDRLHSLTLASSANGYGIPKGGALPEGARTRLEDLARLGPAAFAKARAGNQVHDAAHHPDLVAKAVAAMAQVEPHGYTQAVHMLASGDLAAAMAHVTIRPGFIIGVQDRITPLAQTVAIADAWEAAHGARPAITEIDQAGHAIYLQQPEAFRDALMDHMGPTLKGSSR